MNIILSFRHILTAPMGVNCSSYMKAWLFQLMLVFMISEVKNFAQGAYNQGYIYKV